MSSKSNSLFHLGSLLFIFRQKKCRKLSQWHSTHWNTWYKEKSLKASQTVWSLTFVKCIINFTDSFALHLETLLTVQNNGWNSTPTQVVKDQNAGFVGMGYFSVLIPSPTRVLGLISVSRYFCSGQGFQFQRGKKAKYCTILLHVIGYAMWPFPLQTQRSLTLSRMHPCTQTEKHSHAQIRNYSLVVSYNVHVQRNYTHCVPESQWIFLHTVPHCFLQSLDWVYLNPAHRPESETIKSSIYFSPMHVGSHGMWPHIISSHHLYVINPIQSGSHVSSMSIVVF